jgi:hypothetical protein
MPRGAGALNAPPLPLVQEAALISRSVCGLLNQRQRLRDARELHVIAAKSHAFLAWAAGDLGRLPSAVAHGRAALTLAEEAGHAGAAALALSALSKTAFWGSQARAARVYAQRGFEHGPVNTTRALLACQIADASSDREALAAIASASDALESAAVDDDLGGVFECGRVRVINYAIGVHLKAGDAKGALTASSSARNLRPGEQSIGYGTLAQMAFTDEISDDDVSAVVSAAITAVRGEVSESEEWTWCPYSSPPSGVAAVRSAGSSARKIAPRRMPPTMNGARSPAASATIPPARAPSGLVPQPSIR